MSHDQSYRWTHHSLIWISQVTQSFLNFTFILYFIIDTNVWCRALQVIVLIRSKVIFKATPNLKMIQSDTNLEVLQGFAESTTSER